MAQAAVLILIAMAAAFWWQRARKRQMQKAAHAQKHATRNPYHCVAVRSGNVACEAAKRFGARRFLPDEAPGLPVPGCTARNCACSYAHFDDRREHDRRNPYGQWANVPPAITGERRSRYERRKSPESTFRPSLAR